MIEEVSIKLPSRRLSTIYIGECIHNVINYIDNKNIIIITEKHIYDLYTNQFESKHPVIFIDGGEHSKTLETIHSITNKLIEYAVDRSWYIVGIGGGVVCDITGFIASIYMRGVHFGFVATTLLAQVDASVGGKNGVNFNKYKNVLGTFNQPDFVICDTDTLETLSIRELRAGLAEVIKVALIYDNIFFEYLENSIEKVFRFDKEVINYIVKRSIEIKAEFVIKDEREEGERRKLNLGHTFGHAIEKHSELLHGEAVGIGFIISAKISQQMGLIDVHEFNRIESLLKKINLPLTIDLDSDLLIEAIKKDKKKEDQQIHFILNSGIGDVIVKCMNFTELFSTYKKICGY